jgi:streptomycin 6-kinase
VIPDAFAHEMIRRSGDAGRDWLRSVPARVERLCRQWDAELTGEPTLYGDVNLVFPARRAGAGCVIKICWHEHRTSDEAAALRTWDGRGAVHLLDVGPADNAVLLERLDAGRSLRDLDLLPAAEIAGGLIRTLTVPAPAGIPRLSAIAAEIAATVSPRQRALGDPLPARWIDLTAALATDLGIAAGDDLVHADLHYGNVLAGTRLPWSAIDPKAVAGDPEHSVPELMWTRIDDAADDAAVGELLGVLVAAGKLDAEKARAWTIVRAVDYWLWALGVGFTEDPVRCRRLVEALA